MTLPLCFDYEEISGKFYPVIPIELKAKGKRFFTRACWVERVYSIHLGYALMIRRFISSRRHNHRNGAHIKDTVGRYGGTPITS